MPELPEVETVRKGLAPTLVGARFARVEQRRSDLRFALPPRFAARLTGRRVDALDRRAKYLLAALDSGEVLVMHLGMTGRFVVQAAGGGEGRPGAFAHAGGGDAAHEHLVFHLSNGARIAYNDARRFGYMALVPGSELASHKLFRGLGVEPLGPDLTPAHLGALATRRRADLKAFLMDQRAVAGLGNIYVCEALHRARLSPKRGAATLATKAGAASARAARLVAAIKAVLVEAVAAGGSSLRDYQHTDGSLGAFQHSFAVYGRAGLRCPRPECGGSIRRIVQGARSTFFCPRCQR